MITNITYYTSAESIGSFKHVLILQRADWQTKNLDKLEKELRRLWNKAYVHTNKIVNTIYKTVLQ